MQKDDDDDENKIKSDKSLRKSQSKSSIRSATDIFNVAKEILEKKKAE
jgi:hypothetical protein